MHKLLFFRQASSCILWIAGYWLLTLTACSPNANKQSPGETYLQGEWQQQPEAIHKQLVNYTLYRVKFSCDSFFVAMQSYSKINYGSDTCMNKRTWTEYAKGHYDQRNDTLHLRGFFCNADYTLKNPGGCFRSGVYEDYFKTVKQTDSVVKFTSTGSILPAKLHLIKRIACVPKTL